MITQISRIKKWGDSFAITLDTRELKELGFKEGDFIKLNIEKINEVIDEDIKSYKCLSCEHQFDSQDIHPFCPVCENENLEVIQ